MDRQVPSCMLVDSNPELVDIHSWAGDPYVKEFPSEWRFKRKIPLLIRLRGLEHTFPVGATEINRYPVCRFVCSPNKNMTGQRMACGDFFLCDKVGRVPRPCSEKENKRHQPKPISSPRSHFLMMIPPCGF